MVEHLATHRQRQFALPRAGIDTPAAGQFLADRQRQGAGRRRAAEADIHQMAALLQLDAQQQVRLHGQPDIRRHAPAHPRHQQRDLIAEAGEQAGEQAVQLEAVAAAATPDQLGEHSARLDAHRPVEQHVEVLERQVVQRGVDQPVEIRGGGRHGLPRQAETRQAGGQLFGGEGRQRGHGNVLFSVIFRDQQRAATLVGDEGRQPSAWRALAVQTSTSLSARL
ncbi:hypothetical protein D3C76_643670 [compost metagenome]